MGRLSEGDAAARNEVSFLAGKAGNAPFSGGRNGEKKTSGRRMQDEVNAEKTTGSKRPMETLRGGLFLSWSAVAGLWLLLAAVTVAARLAIGPQFDGLMMAAAAVGAVVVAVRIY